MLTKYKNCSDFWKQKLKLVTRPDYNQASHPLFLCVTVLKSTPSLNFLSDGLISLFILGLEMNRVLILCHKFSLYHLRLSLTREIDIKLNRAKSWAIWQSLSFKNDQSTNSAKLPIVKLLFCERFVFTKFSF